MVEVKSRRGESFETMMRRFKQKIQLSGRVLQVKKIRFHVDKTSKAQNKKAALRRLELAEHYEELRKQGKLPEETRGKFKRR